MINCLWKEKVTGTCWRNAGPGKSNKTAVIEEEGKKNLWDERKVTGRCSNLDIGKRRNIMIAQEERKKPVAGRDGGGNT